MIVKYSVGLDVSSKDIKACISTIDNVQAVKVKSSTSILNTKNGFEALLNWIKKWYVQVDLPICICMEATGIYHENCAYYLKEKGFRVSIILPNKAKRYLQSLGLKSKNDSIDAKGLSKMGAEQSLAVWEPIGYFYYELRMLTRQHQSLQDSIVAAQNRLHAATASAFQIKFEVKQIQKHIAFLQAQLAALGEEIKRLISSDAVMQAKFNKVCKLYGISILSSATIVAETGGFVLFNNYKQLVSYAGYDVVENQSGSRQGKTKISKRGNSRIRRIMHMPALVAIRKKESTFKKLYDRIVEKGGIKMKGIVAVQKKLLVMVYHIWKNDLDYDVNFTNIQKEELVLTSPLALQKPPKKAKQQSLASQGKYPVINHRILPLGKANIIENRV
jgi:transposase